MFNVMEIEIFEVQQALQEGSEPIHLIDVRSPPEVAGGTIPGARTIPLHQLPARLEEIPKEGKVVFYCRTGARSAQACAWLNAQGIDHVYNLRGGIMAWLQGGLAVA